MYNVALIRYGEIVLKGNNRSKFEKKLVDNVKYALRDEDVKVTFSQARLYVEPTDPMDLDRVINKLKKVFGIVSISPAVKISTDWDMIKETSVKLMKEENRIN